METSGFYLRRLTWAATALTTVILLMAGLYNQGFLSAQEISEHDLQYIDVNSETPRINSNELDRTAIVATLDCPLPEQANVIWCATFQMVWDRLRQDIVHAPIHLNGARSLTQRLNQWIFSPNNLEKESYYIAAGMVDDGILEQIQQDMAAKFPEEPKPEFNSNFYTFPKAYVSYAFLKVGLDFPYPYYENSRPFYFIDSKGVRTQVKAFTTFTDKPMTSLIYEQIEVLFYERDEEGKGQAYAVDLCRHSKPYQIILAYISPGKTLRETLDIIEKKSTAYRAQPDYKHLRRLDEGENFTAPDIRFELEHRFRELIGQYLLNPGWDDRFIMEALQSIDFALDRSGAKLRSEAIIGLLGGGSHVLPRSFMFNRPFLVMMKKREPDREPFFMMWVDNPELLIPHTNNEP